MEALNRRNFIKTTGLYVFAISTTNLLACKEKASAAPSPGECETTADILGPYYKQGAPIRENIIPVGSEGTPLIIQGKVYSDCSKALKDASVEIWNANENGEYDMSEEYIFRGKYQTNEEGIYKFKTIIPGRYLNGSNYRPSHIHFRITAPEHIELVSQVYFKDDPYIAGDQWAGSEKAKERILTFKKDESGIDLVQFDIYLNKI